MKATNMFVPILLLAVLVGSAGCEKTADGRVKLVGNILTFDEAKAAANRDDHLVYANERHTACIHYGQRIRSNTPSLGKFRADKRADLRNRDW